MGLLLVRWKYLRKECVGIDERAGLVIVLDTRNEWDIGARTGGRFSRVTRGYEVASDFNKRSRGAVDGLNAFYLG